MKRDDLEHRFVDFIPERLEEGILYVSIEYTTVAHLCCCGCGQEVSITLGPTDWRLIFDGKTVSLEPSIGSWSLPCKSHYFITSNRIVWARQWSRSEIDAGRRYDVARKQPHRADDSPAELSVQTAKESPEKDNAATRGICGWLRSWWN
jgi:hypothetical protein